MSISYPPTVATPFSAPHVETDRSLAAPPSGCLAFLKQVESLVRGPAAPAQMVIAVVALRQAKAGDPPFDHPSWDRVIVETALRLHQACDWQYVINHLGGGHFGVLVPSVAASGPTPKELAQQFRAVFALPFSAAHGLGMQMDVTVGFAIDQPGRCTTSELLRNADIALARATRDGLNWAAYDRDLDSYASDEQTRAAELVTAISRRQFEVRYQLEQEGPSGAPDAVEASIFWQHPDLGPLPMSEFIDTVEAFGLLTDISALVIGEIGRQARVWASRGVRYPGGIHLGADCIENAKFRARVLNGIAMLNPLSLAAH